MGAKDHLSADNPVNLPFLPIEEMSSEQPRMPPGARAGTVQEVRLPLPASAWQVWMSVTLRSSRSLKIPVSVLTLLIGASEHLPTSTEWPQIHDCESEPGDMVCTWF